MRALALPLALVVSLGACASTGGGPSYAGSGPDVIGPEEVRAEESRTDTAYELVQRERPSWLRSRGSSFSGDRTLPRLIVDGTDYGRLDALRQFRVSDVEEIRYLSASDATTRFGTGYMGGAILLETR